MGWSGPLTWRQFAVWQCWLAEQYNRPDRHDYYLMQISAGIAQLPALVWGKQPKGIPFDKLRIPFKTEGQGMKPKRSVKTASLQAQQVWFSRFGGKVRVVKPNGDGQNQHENGENIG